MAPRVALNRGREAFAQRQWARAYADLAAADGESPLEPEDLERLAAADGESPLEPEDLERLAAAAYLTGAEQAAVGLWTRLHHELVDQGNVARAARWGFWLSLNLLLRGEAARSTGWLARADRLLKDRHPGCVEQGYGRVVAGLMAMGSGDPGAAGSHFRTALELAEGFGDPDLLTMALLSHGQLLIQGGRIAEGVAQLDEAMIAVTAGNVDPILAGIVYCAVILTCQRIFDLSRAREWTLAMNEWCAAQPDLVPFRGQCLVHRSEILQQRGDWAAALEEAERACEQLKGRSEAVVGRAFYQRGELNRLRGALAEANRMYRQAARYGLEPQPGASLLLLAQGEATAAAAALRSAVEAAGDLQGPGSALSRLRLLGPLVEVLIAAGDLDAAASAADELAASAARLGAPFLAALSAQACGEVRLARGDREAALRHLREAWSAWQTLAMPYEAARTRVALGRASQAGGDGETARLHFNAASETFRRLGAQPDLQAVARLSTPGISHANVLTEREREVLSLAACGESNRRIAAALDISEHTVARHLSNIYNKLGVTSRTAASVIAHEQGLVVRATHGQS